MCPYDHTLLIFLRRVGLVLNLLPAKSVVYVYVFSLNLETTLTLNFMKDRRYRIGSCLAQYDALQVHPFG